MALPAERQPAYVLHKRAFRETSVIVELLTRDFGHIGGIVRGAKGGGRRVHDIELFDQVVVTWRGRGQLVTVLGCESVATRRLTGNLLFAGLYVNELLVKTLNREEPVAALFHDYGEVLARMASGCELEPTLRGFERRLLEELGYGLVFDADVHSGRRIDHGKTYAVVEGEGFRELGGAVGEPTAGDSALVLSGLEIAAIHAGDYRDRRIRRLAKRLFRRALELRLGGRPLAARRLFSARPRPLEANG